MKIGVSTASLRNFETEDALSVLKETGAETCEVYLRTFYEYRPEFAKKYAANADGTEVSSVCVAPLNFEPQLFCTRRRTRGDGFYWLDQVMRSAQLFGAKKYTFRGSAFGRDNEDIEFTAERLREIADFCGRYGVTLCLENSRGGIYNSPYVFKELKARCPQLAAVFNIREARKTFYPWQTYVKDMTGAVSHIIVSDVDENGNVCLPGNGLYDFKEIFKTLSGEGFDGAALIEAENFSDLSELKRSVEFLKDAAQN